MNALTQIDADQDVAQSRIQIYLDRFREKNQLPGISVCALMDGRYVRVNSGFSHAEEQTPMTSDSCFMLSCTAKFLTALVVVQLASKGRLNLDVPISSYLPKLRGNAERISLRHLLSHSAGFQCENLTDPDVVAEYTWDEFADTFERREQLFEPGSVFDYSHSAYAIVDEVLRAQLGQDSTTLVKELILSPLGIAAQSSADSDTRLVPDHIFVPNLGRYVALKPVEWCRFWAPSMIAPLITLDDLVNICSAALTNPAVFAPLAKNHLLNPVIMLPGQAGRGQELPVSFGLGCGRYNTGLYGFGGHTRGQCSAVRFSEDGKFVIAVGIASNQLHFRDVVINSVAADLLQGKTDLAQPKLFRCAHKPFDFADLVGVYQGAKHSSFLVSVEEDKLNIRRGHNPTVARGAGDQRLVVTKDAGQRLVVHNAPNNVSVGFFPDPSTFAPCLAVGMNTFCKT